MTPQESHAPDSVPGPLLYAVVGATGTGKSEFALRLADQLAQRGRPA